MTKGAVEKHVVDVVAAASLARDVASVDQVLNDGVHSPTSRAISARRTSLFWAMQTNTWAWFVKKVHDGTSAEGVSFFAMDQEYCRTEADSWLMGHGTNNMLMDVILCQSRD